MSYDYQTERAHIFTEEGQRMFLSMRDGIHKLIDVAGAVTGGKAMMVGTTGGGDSWMMMACVDRLVEMGELNEIPTHGLWQDRVFVKGPAR